MISAQTFDRLQQLFGDRVQADAPIAPHCTVKIGGPADILVTLKSKHEIVQALNLLWETGETYYLLGNGSNVLFSDNGFRGVILLNQATDIQIFPDKKPPVVWAESGASLSSVARYAASQGYSGLEWAGPIPGTLGGAVYGNAGAYGCDLQNNLVMAEILHRETGIQHWSNDQMLYRYRSSGLKRNPGSAVILSAVLRVEVSTREKVQEKMDEFIGRRKISQPPGASWGSTFRNPPGDYAARLIDAAGLKGTRIGGAVISERHANFFINDANATASDMKALIEHARQTVAEKLGVQLELEIEILGKWDNGSIDQNSKGNGSN